jgi:hypothetical protein
MSERGAECDLRSQRPTDPLSYPARSEGDGSLFDNNSTAIAWPLVAGSGLPLVGLSSLSACCVDAAAEGEGCCVPLLLALLALDAWTPADNRQAISCNQDGSEGNGEAKVDLPL